METTKTIKPKTMAEMLPGLSGILSKDTMHTLTAKKQPRPAMAQTRTAEKVLKPLTIAEMRADIQALKIQSPRRFNQAATSTKKKKWNSSIKVERKISHTADGQLRDNPVRKVLDFQPKPKVTNSKLSMHKAPETPKFPKPDFRAKKSLLQAKNIVRISGVSNIPETPLVSNPVKSRMTIGNKENYSYQPRVIREKQTVVPQKPNNKQNNNKLHPQLKMPDTSLSNESWKSSCDASFLQREKEINDIEIKVQAITEEQTLENIAEVSPPVSTPFKEYRNVKEYFNNSSELENSALYNDNTIMCFDKPVETGTTNNDNKREESVIVSLCDLLNKAKVSNKACTNSELDDLLEVEKETEHNIKIIDSAIMTLDTIKKSQMKSLKCVQKLIHDKTHGKSVPECDKDKTLEADKSPILRKTCSVIKSTVKSPSYTIHKKNSCLRKKACHKSMPNVSTFVTPSKDINGRALNMYMQLKGDMGFLNTPRIKNRNTLMPDTPAITSNNLQRQLDKLFGGS
ncbi:uncharacterized protein LOC131850740 [Achroia grisella]|uniref:uncharacterized protein LOC131850740 n=1 Tax=Achroia grisella TaxID=688607 RepID=UPI0027D330A1|nr:uncharacterized protein LOC131850740 [Achroia grisella]